MFVTYLLTVGELAGINGGVQANFSLKKNDTKVRITTVNAPLDGISSTGVITVGNDILFQYDGMYLLTYNDKRYYIIDGVDANCTPLKIYIVKDEDVRSVQLLQSEHINCTKPTPPAKP
jgi:hypothetical protein